MDWKQGLTTAVIIGLSYLGINAISKKESFSAEPKKGGMCKSNTIIRWEDVDGGLLPILKECNKRAVVTCDNYYSQR